MPDAPERPGQGAVSGLETSDTRPLLIARTLPCAKHGRSTQAMLSGSAHVSGGCSLPPSFYQEMDVMCQQVQSISGWESSGAITDFSPIFCEETGPV